MSQPKQEVFPDSVDGVSQVEEVPSSPPIALEPRRRQMADAFTTLDPVDLNEVFKCRANVIRVVPHVVRGVFRFAIRAALEEVIAGMHSEVTMGRRWKLLMLWPMMLLNRRRGGHIPRTQLENRFRRFQEGEWIQLLSEGQESAAQALRSSVRRRRRHRPDDVRDRASRFAVGTVGRIVSSPTSMEGAQLAPGDLTTLRALTDPDRRPPVPREPLTEEVATAQPVTPFELDPFVFLLCLRTARRGAAPGPSGMTSNHLFPFLESDHDSDLFSQVGSLLATGNIPTEVLEGFRLGRS